MDEPLIPSRERPIYRPLEMEEGSRLLVGHGGILLNTEYAK
jgi:hypothetical protein